MIFLSSSVRCERSGMGGREGRRPDITASTKRQIDHENIRSKASPAKKIQHSQLSKGPRCPEGVMPSFFLLSSLPKRGF